MKIYLRSLFAGAMFAFFACSAGAVEDTDNVIGHFEITGFAVDGNSLLAQHDIDALLAPFAGKNRDFGDVQRALEALENAYHQRSFNLVQVILPEQELNHGVVRFQVIEARIGKVTVTGNKLFDESNIRRSLPGLQEGQTPNIADISASLRMANENPAKNTQMHLQNSERDGEVDAELTVKEDSKAWTAGLTVDNSGNSSTGAHHIGAVFQNANVAGLDHVLGMQYLTTVEKPNQISVYGFGYHVPLYKLGDSVDLFGSYSDVDSGSVLAGLSNLQISGKGTVFGGRYNQTLVRDGSYASTLSYGLDYKAYRNSVLFSGTQLGSNVTVHPVSLSYGGIWTQPSTTANFSVTALHNIPGGAQGGSADFQNARLNASANYSVLRYAANYSHALLSDWHIRLLFNGQYTSNSLIPGEQFGAGGAASVRGFSERELSNDKGNSLSAELYTPNLCNSVKQTAMQCRMLGFSDWASLERNNPLPGEQAHASIASIGAGLRVSMDKNVNWQLDVGHVIDAGITQEKGSNRVHFKLVVSY